MTHDEVEEQALRCDEHADQCHDAGALGWRDTFNDAADLLRRLRDENIRLTAELSAAEMAFRASEQAHLEARNKALDEAASSLRATAMAAGQTRDTFREHTRDWRHHDIRAKLAATLADNVLSLKTQEPTT